MALYQIFVAEHEKVDGIASDLVTVEEVCEEACLRRVKEYFSTLFHIFLAGRGGQLRIFWWLDIVQRCIGLKRIDKPATT